jgi:hypothetical protein
MVSPCSYKREFDFPVQIGLHVCEGSLCCAGRCRSRAMVSPCSGAGACICHCSVAAVTRLIFLLRCDDFVFCNEMAEKNAIALHILRRRTETENLGHSPEFNESCVFEYRLSLLLTHAAHFLSIMIFAFEATPWLLSRTTKHIQRLAHNTVT